ALGVLFALIMLLIIYSSGSGSEVFPYSRLRGRARRPPDLKKWGVKSGYLPVCGNKVRAKWRGPSPAHGACGPQTLTARCHQCVIVTSSSHLLGTRLGTAIDGAECTIRMNDAPTTGYEVDVGNKTSFRVVAHSSLYRVLKRPQEFVNKTPETIFIFWGPPAKMQKSLLKIIQRVSTSFPNMTAYVVSPGRMKQFDDLFRGETGKDRYPRATSCTVPHFFPGPFGLAPWGWAAAPGWGFPGQVGDPGGGPSSRSPPPHPVSPPQGEVALMAQHRLVHHGDCGGAV
uniref:Alpha-N-acetylgalactosaminide alpha-2,6-sialyltransferase 6 n=1 Tax=Bubo bubo TaxID=30461 RepID=A0A8C0FLB6_BUBBB